MEKEEGIVEHSLIMMMIEDTELQIHIEEENKGPRKLQQWKLVKV